VFFRTLVYAALYFPLQPFEWPTPPASVPHPKPFKRRYRFVEALSFSFELDDDFEQVHQICFCRLILSVPASVKADSIYGLETRDGEPTFSFDFENGPQGLG
jgi:hypothetical protein